ncbi:MAG: ATP-dependent DNA helicase RecG [Actinomycetota bacterium]|nr:ATP-dependent DNA helicase RecG [Actinomycetota bacterium]
MTDLLGSSLTSLLGGRSATALDKALGLRTAEDLVRHYPRRYAERGELTDLASLAVGERVTVMAEIRSVTVRPMRQRRGSILEAVITDGTATMSLTFFNQKWREREFRAGRTGLFAGQVTVYGGKRQLSHPECMLLPDGVADDPLAVAAFAGALIPIYPAGGSVTTWDLQKAVQVVLDQLGEPADPIPDEVRAASGLCTLADALWQVHRPTSREDVDIAVKRLRFEEAFTLQAVLAQRRAEVAALPATRRTPASTPMLDAFDRSLPFTLTVGQREIGEQIRADLGRDHPMHRLLQGDVGSGKTVVALRAMLAVVDAGGQAALLAPTEVLAAQHLRSITGLLGPLATRGQLGGGELGTSVALLTGSQRSAGRRAALLDIVTGDAGIVIGTHALIQEAVDFHDLALVVVDEQHRFGVEQRAALAAKSRDGSRPHVLVMTATPIPRTVAMTVFGDVDVSTLAELPSGRAGVATHVVAGGEQPRHVARVWERVREEVAGGHRVFVVCPRIDEGADDDADGRVDAGPSDDAGEDAGVTPMPMTAVVPLAALLAEGELSGLRIATLHGRMAAEEKEQAMRRFASEDTGNAVDVLVATTVVEVGVDVPRATMMVIMDADRFGISQLHQLRGLVGRGSLPGLCLLVTQAPVGSPARDRLAAVAATTDGFALSALDLELRREGDVLGSMQSGRRSSLRLLEVARHEEVIVAARDAATAVLEADPALERHPALAAAVVTLRADEHAEFLEKG